MQRRTTALLVLVLVAACGGTGGEDTARPLRVAVPRWPGYEPLHVADTSGLFAARGIDIEIVDFVSNGDAERAFARGEVDGFAGSLGNVVALDPRRGREPVGVLLTDYSAGADLVIGRRGLRGVADLQGGTVGLAHTPRELYLLSRALQLAGVDRDEVRLVHADATELPDLLREGRVDAVVSLPPDAAELLLEGYPALFTSAEIPREIIDVVAFGRDVIEARRADVREFVAAWQDALDRLEERPEETRRVMADREGMAPEELRAVLRMLHTFDLREQAAPGQADVVAGTCRRVAATLAATGTMRSRSDGSGCVDLSLAQEAQR